MVFFAQRARQAFGPVIQGELSRLDCRQADIAVAWVRASGLLHIEQPFLDLLARGAAARVVVGLDGDNTSEEGLQGLAAIAAASEERLSVFVRHNEAGPIFHPKMYAFRTDEELRLFVGSNNLTQSGLFQNEELTVLKKTARGSSLERRLDEYMNSLTDPTDDLVRPLTGELLTQLVEEGYVKGEAALRGKLIARQRSARTRNALFGSRPVRAPARPVAPGPVPTQNLEPIGLAVAPDWQVLYLRVRTARGHQAQVPIPVVREIRRRIGAGALDGPVDLKSRQDGTVHQIRPAGAAKAGNNVNTYKFEAVPVDGDTLLRIYLVGNELFYEFLGGDDPLGTPVLAHLREGFETDPPRTHSTRPDPENSTWYRFD